LRFSHAARAAYPGVVLGRVLRVARAGDHAWAGRGVSARAQAAADLAAQLAAAHARRRATYGVPRIHAARRAAGPRTARRRVARRMRAGGRAGGHRRRRARTTGVDPLQRPAPNLVAREFAAPAPHRLWLGDIPAVPTGAGWRYLAVVRAAHARRVSGGAMADHLRTALALAARARAVRARRPGAGLVHHTDRGGQDTATA